MRALAESSQENVDKRFPADKKPLVTIYTFSLRSSLIQQVPHSHANVCRRE